MWYKRYLNLSKVEIFILIFALIFLLLLLFGVKVDKNSISFLFLKVPIQVKGSISQLFWKNYHSVFITFAFFSYMIMAVDQRDNDLSRPFLFLLFVYVFLSIVFGLKFGFPLFGRSFLAFFFLLFTLYTFLFFFETLLNSRGIGAIFVVLVNAFSGLMTYLYNFRDVLLTGIYPSLIEAKYFSLPIYQKYTIDFDFRNLFTPILLLIASLVYKFIVRKGLVGNE